MESSARLNQDDVSEVGGAADRAVAGSFPLPLRICDARFGKGRTASIRPDLLLNEPTQSAVVTPLADRS
jgi:hypothetical protein